MTHTCVFIFIYFFFGTGGKQISRSINFYYEFFFHFFFYKLCFTVVNILSSKIVFYHFEALQVILVTLLKGLQKMIILLPRVLGVHRNSKNNFSSVKGYLKHDL